jgi:Zn-dependent alcohol dehydrogenase
MGESTANKVDVAAVREHVVGARRTRAHVIICHDIDHKRRTLMDLFGLTSTVEPEICQAIARALAEDILRDVEMLKSELAGIERFARYQLAKLEPLPKG